MSRPLRIEYPGAWYHVMNRGRRGEDIFNGIKDREIFLSLLMEAAELWGVRISAYCLMDNHYHILAHTPQGNLSRFMRHLNGVYTQRYNRQHGYDGQLFRGRFKSILVEEDSYLLELVRYIHRNPLRAGIVEKLENYPWCSHIGYLSKKRDWEWLHKDFILAMLGAGRKKSLAAYSQYMRQDDSDELLEVFERKKWPSFLGGEKFVAWVKATFFQRKKHQQVPESAQLTLDLATIKQEVCLFYGVKENDLLSAKRGQVNEPRNVAIYLGRVLCNCTLKELGQEFGMTGYSPAGSAVERVKRKIYEDKQFELKINKVLNTVLISKEK